VVVGEYGLVSFAVMPFPADPLEQDLGGPRLGEPRRRWRFPHRPPGRPSTAKPVRDLVIEDMAQVSTIKTTKILVREQLMTNPAPPYQRRRS
jgi:hypothetical protein